MIRCANGVRTGFLGGRYRLSRGWKDGQLTFQGQRRHRWRHGAAKSRAVGSRTEAGNLSSENDLLSGRQGLRPGERGGKARDGRGGGAGVLQGEVGPWRRNLSLRFSSGLVEKSPVAWLRASEALLGLVSGSSGARLRGRAWNPVLCWLGGALCFFLVCSATRPLSIKGKKRGKPIRWCCHVSFYIFQ